jgi:hypothetical protein
MYLRAGALSFRRLDFRPFRTNWLAVGIDSLSIGRAAPSVAQVNPHAPFGRQERIILSVGYGCQQIRGYPQTHPRSSPDARPEHSDSTSTSNPALTILVTASEVSATRRSSVAISFGTPPFTQSAPTGQFVYVDGVLHPLHHTIEATEVPRAHLPAMVVFARNELWALGGVHSSPGATPSKSSAHSELHQIKAIHALL